MHIGNKWEGQCQIESHKRMIKCVAVLHAGYKLCEHNKSNECSSNWHPTGKRIADNRESQQVFLSPVICSWGLCRA